VLSEAVSPRWIGPDFLDEEEAISRVHASRLAHCFHASAPYSLSGLYGGGFATFLVQLPHHALFVLFLICSPEKGHYFPFAYNDPTPLFFSS